MEYFLTGNRGINQICLIIIKNFPRKTLDFSKSIDDFEIKLINSLQSIFVRGL